MDVYTERELAFFDMCLVSILSFQYHPGNDQSRPPDEEAIRRVMLVAALATRLRRSYLGGE